MSDPRDLKINQLELEVAILKTARDEALKRMIAEQNASLATGRHILQLEESLKKYIDIEGYCDTLKMELDSLEEFFKSFWFKCFKFFRRKKRAYKNETEI